MRFELSIYGTNDEVIKKYETNHIRWGLLIKATKIQEEIAGKSQEEQFKAISDFIKEIFVGITDEDITNADYLDVINTFKQLINSVSNINSEKNA